MKYYRDDSEGQRRRVSDWQVKQAAWQRIRQRRLRKLAWWAGVIAVLAIFYFTIGGSLLSRWVGRQVEAVKEEARGMKRTGRILGREKVKETIRELIDEPTSSPPSAGQ